MVKVKGKGVKGRELGVFGVLGCLGVTVKGLRGKG